MKFFRSEEYQPQINLIFDRVDNEIRELVSNARIEHIGASSIPGAISKGDLDIFVGVEKDRIEETIHLLNASGYWQKKDTLQTESLRVLETDKYGVDVAIQLVANESEFEMFLVFRDTLRGDDKLLNEYNKLKLCCAHKNADSYRSSKSKFIESVLSEYGGD